MGRYALSLVQRKRNSSLAKEAVLHHALDTFQSSQLSSVPPTASQVAEQFGISRTTLWRRIHGGRSNKEAHEAFQLLTPSEEDILVHLAQALGVRLLPLSHVLLREKANALLVVRAEGPVVQEVGKRWSYRFLNRHSAELSMYWSAALNNKHGLALNPTNVREYFEVLTEIDRERHIKPKFKFAMDESPVLLGMEMTTRVIGPAGQTLQHKLHDGNRESASLVVTICADGSVPFPPTIILSGQNYLKRWAEHNSLNASIALSPTGYTTDSLTLDWMHEFEAQTRPTGDEAGEWRLLALDNHGSHLTLAFLDYAAAYCVEVVGYIPNSTHVLQGLDVACFGAFKMHYTHALADYQRRTSSTVTKEVFLELVKEPFERTFIPSTILSAFRITGLEPIDSHAISPDQLAPSQENSAPTVFPLELPDPVQAMLPLLRAVKLDAVGDNSDRIQSLESAAMETSRLLKRSTAAFTVGPTTGVTSASALPPPPILHAPSIPPPTQQLLNSTPVHPGVYTAAELERKVVQYEAALAEAEKRNTASQAIIDAQNCTIALQEVGLEAQRLKLSEKESRRVSNKDKLLVKKVGRRLSGPEFRAAVKADDEARDVAKRKRAMAKDARSLKAEIRKQKSAWRKREQAERKAHRAADLKAWTEECERCQVAGKKKPKPPPRIKKAKTPTRFTEELAEEENKENTSEDGQEEEDRSDSD